MHPSEPFPILPRWLPMLACLVFACLMHAPAALASNSILIWPIDPVIEHDEQAAALWLENRGKAPALLQLRVFGWQQADGDPSYAAQQEVTGSPPMIRIEPGEKQLVRLTRTGPVPAGSERAYRVIIDEIPTPDATADDSAASVGIKFQLRYSIPLFVHGEGVWTKQRHDRERDPATAARPVLAWRRVERDGGSFVEIRNTGPVHARLTEAAFVRGGASTALAPGLLGYVLPGSVSRWPLPDGASGELMAKVNGDAVPITILPAP